MFVYMSFYVYIRSCKKERKEKLKKGWWNYLTRLDTTLPILDIIVTVVIQEK